MAHCPVRSIFVSVASYRDTDCPMTVFSAFHKAEFPCRVYVGICQQNSEGDLDCLSSQEGTIPLGQIRILRLDSKEARGPTYARERISTELARDETYFLQVDSHTRWVQGWDTKLIEMGDKLESLGVDKWVLSHYPKHFDPDQSSTLDPEAQDDDLSAVPVICKSFFNERGMISFEGAQFLPASEVPRPNAYIAAGMMFCRMSAIREVPFPQDLNGLFVGEEILMSIKFWTSGYDIFTPTENTLYHYYSRNKGEPKFWSLRLDDKEAHEKVKQLLQLTKGSNNSALKLGTVRTLQEYYEWTGIQPSHRMVQKSFCENSNKSEIIPTESVEIPFILPIVALTLVLLIMFSVMKN
jgi:[Skp1-protein]-hydroxyproline N-acetylglucosaminyltransferase